MYFNWAPPIGNFVALGQDPLGSLAQFVLPAICLGITQAGGILRIQLNTLVAEARRRAGRGGADSARRLYAEALAYIKMKGSGDPSAATYRAKIDERLREIP